MFSLRIFLREILPVRTMGSPLLLLQRRTLWRDAHIYTIRAANTRGRGYFFSIEFGGLFYGSFIPRTVVYNNIRPPVRYIFSSFTRRCDQSGTWGRILRKIPSHPYTYYNVQDTACVYTQRLGNLIYRRTLQQGQRRV